MTKKQLSLLLDYIDARILEKSEDARASSDGGLVESIQTAAIRSELYETTEETK